MKHMRTYLTVEAAAFATAALVHAGVLLDGYQHAKAMTAESVIAAVLVLGIVGSLMRPAATRALALGTQAFALLGTAVGLFTIAIGVGPRTAFDLALHAAFVALLVSGLIAARQGRAVVERHA